MAYPVVVGVRQGKRSGQICLGRRFLLQLVLLKHFSHKRNKQRLRERCHTIGCGFSLKASAHAGSARDTRFEGSLATFLGARCFEHRRFRS